MDHLLVTLSRPRRPIKWTSPLSFSIELNGAFPDWFSHYCWSARDLKEGNITRKMSGKLIECQTSSVTSHPSQSCPCQKTRPLSLPQSAVEEAQAPQFDHCAGTLSVLTAGLTVVLVSTTQQEPAWPATKEPQLLTPHLYSVSQSPSLLHSPSP